MSIPQFPELNDTCRLLSARFPLSCAYFNTHSPQIKPEIPFLKTLKFSLSPAKTLKSFNRT